MIALPSSTHQEEGLPLEGTDLVEEGHRLVLNPRMRLLSELGRDTDGRPHLFAQQGLTRVPMALLLPLYTSFPEFCPYEDLLAAFEYGRVTEDSSARCRTRLHAVLEKQGMLQKELKATRNALSLLGQKLHKIGIEIKSIHELGYSLRRRSLSLPKNEEDIQHFFLKEHVLAIHSEQNTISQLTIETETEKPQILGICKLTEHERRIIQAILEAYPSCAPFSQLLAHVYAQEITPRTFGKAYLRVQHALAQRTLEQEAQSVQSAISRASAKMRLLGHTVVSIRGTGYMLHLGPHLQEKRIPPPLK